ncbi:unnamed protein product [Vitrella brassicaformis CCMP3155]|uniref:dolichyl-phosphate-mannose--protein mannosyltransferase n=4 Tax=Vitrella brassicaformis TaxID=1169539 RepID=A0A0G4EMW8_VITBC|nr:unnamed protein product [Vitrella brassicaformis CCMP3155]|eukprot:CEL98362.1 unnamed protein product [Vitrella brassicaformis CCMP3155]
MTDPGATTAHQPAAPVPSPTENTANPAPGVIDGEARKDHSRTKPDEDLAETQPPHGHKREDGIVSVHCLVLWLGCIGLVVLSSGVFYRCRHYTDWFVDELFAVVRNADARGETPLKEVLSNDFWGNRLHFEEGQGWTHKSYRPLTILSYAAQIKWGWGWGGNTGVPDARPLRLFNCVLHTSNSLLVLALQVVVCGVPPLLAAASSGLFAAHPVHTENIVYLVGRADALATFFYLAGALAYFGMQKGGAKRHTTRSTEATSLIVAVACSILAGLSKETGFTLPVFLAACEMILFPPSLWRCSGLLASFLCLFKLRSALVGGTQVGFSPVDTPIPYESSRLTRWLSYMNLHRIYFGLMVLPWNLCWDYSYDSVPMVTSITDPRCIQTLLVYALLFSGGVYGLLAIRWPQRHVPQLVRCLIHPLRGCSGGSQGQQPLLDNTISAEEKPTEDTSSASAADEDVSSEREGSTVPASPAEEEAVEEHADVSKGTTVDQAAARDVFGGEENGENGENGKDGRARPTPGAQLLMGLSFIIVPFMPASNVFFTVGTVIGERLLYPSTVGWSLVLSAIGGLLWGPGEARSAGCRRGRRVAVLAAYMAFLLLLGGWYVWRSAVRVEQWSSRASLFVADARVNPRSAKVLHMYAATLHSSGRYDEALRWYNESLAIFDDNALTDYAVIQIYLVQNRFRDAYERFQKVLGGHFNGFGNFNRWLLLIDFGFTLIVLERYAEGIPVISEGLSLMSEAAYAQNALAYAHYKTGSLDKALDAILHAIRLESGNWVVWNNAAVVAATGGRIDYGMSCLQQAAERCGGTSAADSRGQAVLAHNARLMQQQQQQQSQGIAGGVGGAGYRFELFYPQTH